MPSSAAKAVDHYENFPVASWLTPKRMRSAVQAIYWFARTADDIADEGDAPASQRLADLAAYRADLQHWEPSAIASQRWPQVFGPLAQEIARHQLPLDLLDALLQAFEQDVRYTEAQRWYAHHDELLHYCQRSANPIGRLLLHLYGVQGERELAASDAICSALQLINFWQDPSRDLPRQRSYFPLDAMARFGLTAEDLLACQDSPNTIKLIAHCVDLARARMLQGIELPAAVRHQLRGFDGWRLSLELRCVIQGGLRILEKIQALQYRTLSQRPKLTAWDGVLVLWRAFWQRG